MLIFKNENLERIEQITWTAPIENVDGSPIDYALTYRLYIDDIPTMTFPGSLNETGVYSFPLADVGAIQAPGTIKLELTAFPEGVDLEQEPERESAKSNSIQVLVAAVLVPKEPADLSTE